MSSLPSYIKPTLRLVPNPKPLPSPHQGDTAPPGSEQDRRVQKLLEIMHEDIRLPHTLQTLAAGIELGPRQCERLFKGEMQQSPLQYLLELRLTRACALLRQEFKNVSEIADAVGFENVSYFIRVFKARFGCTPLVYRKAYAGATGVKKMRDVAKVL